jgi:uncharacterized membrane protein YhaH (DUF805 family)/TPR repeat protein
MSPLKLFFSFKGRIGRKLFWLGIITPTCIIAIALNFLQKTNIYNDIIHVLGYSLVAWIVAAGFSKRLHDLNQSSWLQLLFFVPVTTLYLLSTMSYNQPWIIASGYVTFLIGLWMSIKAGIIQGTFGKNNFDDNTPPHSISYFRWFVKLKSLYNRKINSEQRPDKANKNKQNSPVENSLPNNKQDKRSDILESWLNKTETNSVQSKPLISDEKNKESERLDGPFETVEPEILRTTNSVFGDSKLERSSKITSAVNQVEKQALPENTSSPIVVSESNNDINTIPARTNIVKQKPPNEEQVLESDTKLFLQILKMRATTSPTHQLYLQNNAESGNSWAKLEIAATWLSNISSNKDQAQQAMRYLGELANSSQSHLGAETEASYFLGEIYRIGLRYTRPNEDLSFKYLIRAAASGHKTAQRNLATQIVHTASQKNETPLVLSIINKALHDTESATALMQLIEFDWSITYFESVSLVLRTLVDQGDGQAARFLGKMLLEGNDYETAVRVLNLADKLDNTTIDKIVDIIKVARTTEININSFVNIIKKHAKLDNSYAHYQMANAFNEGVGMPQDKMMAYVHITMASARVYGHERDKLIKSRDELRGLLTDEEIIMAQEIIREEYRR